MKRLLSLLIGLAAILVALAMFAYAYSNYARTIEVQQLPVPLHDIPPYTLLTGDMFVMKEYPRALQAGYATSVAALNGRIAATLLPAGYPVPAPLAADSAGYRFAPPEKTVISIPVSPSVAVGGELRPGMRIDIYRLVPPAASRSAYATPVADATPEPAPAPIVVKIAAGVVVVEVLGDMGHAGQQNAATNGPLGSSQPAEAPARILVLALTPQEAQAVLALIAETKRDALLWIALTPLIGSGS
jgi:Flp pilus assembly protein CpaB